MKFEGPLIFSGVTISTCLAFLLLLQVVGPARQRAVITGVRG